MEHTSFDNVVLDEAASTVYLTDRHSAWTWGCRQGYAAGAVAAALPTGMVLSLGGNVCVTGPKPDGSPWVIGVQNLMGTTRSMSSAWISPAARWSPAGLSTVLHGGRRRLPPYHRPGYRLARPALPVRDGHLRGLGLADALSTAAFIMDEESGRILLETYGAEALWVYADGSASWTGGCDAYFHS